MHRYLYGILSGNRAGQVAEVTLDHAEPGGPSVTLEGTIYGQLIGWTTVSLRDAHLPDGIEQ